MFLLVVADLLPETVHRLHTQLVGQLVDLRVTIRMLFPDLLLVDAFVDLQSSSVGLVTLIG